MENLKTGDIIAFRTKFNLFKPLTYLSAAIRFFAKVKHNHIGVLIVENNVPLL